MIDSGEYAMMMSDFVTRLTVAYSVNFLDDGGVQCSDKEFTVQTPAIAEFLAWAWNNRKHINKLKLVRIDKSFDRDMKWINSVASKCGIKLRSRRVASEHGDRKLIYSVDKERLQFVSEILKRRFKYIHAPALRKLKLTGALEKFEPKMPV